MVNITPKSLPSDQSSQQRITVTVVPFIHLVHIGAISRQLGVHHDVQKRAEALAEVFLKRFKDASSRGTIAAFLKEHRRRSPRAVRVVLQYVREAVKNQTVEKKKESSSEVRSYEHNAVADSLFRSCMGASAAELLAGEEDGRIMADYVLQQALGEMAADTHKSASGKHLKK